MDVAANTPTLPLQYLQALMDVAACADAAEEQQQQQQQQQALSASPSPSQTPSHATQGGPIAIAAAAPTAAAVPAGAANAYQAVGEGCLEGGEAEEKPNLWELLHESMKVGKCISCYIANLLV
eukprot:168809-Pelagomonas_calceolata.AAC.1